MGDWPSFLDEAGPMPGLSGAADEARDRLVETFIKYKYKNRSRTFWHYWLVSYRPAAAA